MIREHGHEAEAELPDAQARRLWIAISVSCLEIHFQSMTVQRLNSVEKCRVYRRRPIRSELHIEHCVYSECKVADVELVDRRSS